ncbi:DMT family transporter [Psychromicrobium lacuslunae]|uniref:DMT family transporter n=1 Tax=Psychromicrobium lacuslunae TaxID=1618207 RepID=UPI0009E35752|nr:DMT family transporter [Psychromicrobium lacuslunae]
MEGKFRWLLIVAIAPVAWGSNYYVTRNFLPADYPLYGALFRALPAGLLLLIFVRKLPSGSWWWKALILGTLNVAAFFVLIYLASQLLPSSIAATIMATSPLVMMGLAWLLLAERPMVLQCVGAVFGVAGVALLLGTASNGVSTPGVLASVAAMLLSSCGYVLSKKWGAELEILTLTSWQLVAGGLLLIPVAIGFEGAPPALTMPSLLGFGYVTVIATAVAFVTWFAGLRHLGFGSAGLLGLLNPVTGVFLGVVLAGELLNGQQVGGLGMVFFGILIGQPLLTQRFRRAKGLPIGGTTPGQFGAPGQARTAREDRGATIR